MATVEYDLGLVKGDVGAGIIPVTSAVSNISAVPGARIGDVLLNAGAAVLTILGVSAAVGGLVRITGATTGTAVGNIRGTAGAAGAIDNLAGAISEDWGNLIFLGTDGKLLAVDKEDTLIDPRDGKRYRTVLMPDGKRWMAQNLNYVTPTSFEYNNDPANGAKYGRLYTWDEALTVAPPGWHLPAQSEWGALPAAVGGALVAGAKLKSKSGWNSNGNGTDDYGFSALPGGYYNDSNGAFRDLGGWAGLWLATESSSGSAYGVGINSSSNNVTNSTYYKTCGYSVRLVKD
jgi:uncharacterized protein (TIGR02145 family)